MKNYFKILSVVLSMAFIFSSVSLFSANAEGEYVRPDKFIYGDVNQDGEVTVKDVTYIQKGLAEIHYVNAVQRFLADPDNAGFSIKNATAIQKYLAQYETKTPWGEEYKLKLGNKFSSDINQDKYIDYEYIIVQTKNLSHTYTLEDFPEYNFTCIKKTSNLFGIDFYYLYLPEADIESVIEAITALNYRANIDLYNVTPAYVAISA